MSGQAAEAATTTAPPAEPATTADEAAVQPAPSTEKAAEGTAVLPVVEEAEEGEAEASPPEDKESTYGLAVEPEAAFDTARSAAKQLHECLDRLLQGKGAETNGGSDFSFLDTARTMQLELLTLRRAHRAMAKAADAGRADELAARRVADAEHANLETRVYESTCCRAAARRCRNFRTPQLNKLRPLLEKGEEEDEEEEDDGPEENGASSSGLAARLEAERAKRTSLFEELETLEKQKAKDLEAFREISKVNEELFTRLRAVEQALEPVCELLPFRKRPNEASPVDAGIAELPAPLQLVYSKFDVLATFGSGGKVVVRVEGGKDSKPPPEKRAKVEAVSSAAKQQPAVVVEIARTSGAKVTLRFFHPHRCLVTVAMEGGGGDALLDALWPGDDGRNTSLVAMLPGETTIPGRPYGWAQVLAGLRETLLVEAPSLQQVDAVTAADVVHRVRSAAEKKA